MENETFYYDDDGYKHPVKRYREEVGFYDDENGQEYFRDFSRKKIFPINGVYPKLLFQLGFGYRMQLICLQEDIDSEKDSEKKHKMEELKEKLYEKFYEETINIFKRDKLMRNLE